MRSLSISLFTIASVLIGTYALPFPSDDAAVAALITAATQVERISLLNDTDFVFDFFHPNASAFSASGLDGKVVIAKRDTFPALTGNGVALAVGFLGPCALNTPHIHPRATEFNFNVNGTLRTGFLQENGARFVMNTIYPGQAALFPQGAIHFQQNLGCEPVIFVAAFSFEDPGTSTIANNFFSLPDDIVSATLGQIGVQEVLGLESKIPKNVVYGVQQCLQTCNLTIPSNSSAPSSYGPPPNPVS
jgi:oxalate decarboxylase/phosphoglucose isomerase-like protein (cupin superfamily)